jgi:hypothetical protein
MPVGITSSPAGGIPFAGPLVSSKRSRFCFRYGSFGFREKGQPMTDTIQEQAFYNEIPDEALERAGTNEIASQYTLANCTGLSECPG